MVSVEKVMRAIAPRADHCLRRTAELYPPPKQSLMVSRSFGRPITTLTEIREAVATYTTRAAEKLRQNRVAAGVVTVFLMTNRFTDEPQYANSVTIPLPVTTQDTADRVCTPRHCTALP
jgi:DNA polymerase V